MLPVVSHRRPRPAVLAYGFLAAAIILAIAAITPNNGVEAAVVSFEVEMAGANEVPAASSPGHGFARFTFDDETRVLTYAVWVRGLSPNQVTASHIHRAPPGVAGPPVHTLASGPFESISGSITLSAADVADLMAGNLYVNIHSTANPAGFARGQLMLPGGASPSPIAPPSTGDGGLLRPESRAGTPVLLATAAFAAIGIALAIRGARRA